MNYHKKYRKEDFPLIKFKLSGLPDKMLGMLHFIIHNSDFVFVGGAATDILLGEHGELSDIDIFVAYYFIDHIHNHLANSDILAFWDINYYGDPKCAIFFREDEGFYKIELAFRELLPPAFQRKELTNNECLTIHCASCEWLLTNKLEKINRSEVKNMQIPKFNSHVEACIKLAEYMRHQNLTTLFPEFAILAKRALSKTFHPHQAVNRLQTLIELLVSKNS